MPSFPVLPESGGFFFAAPLFAGGRSLPAPRWSLNQPPLRLTGGKLKDQLMLKIRLSALALAGMFVLTTTARAQYADSVVSYNRGIGASSSYTNPAAALGEPSRVTPGTYGGPVDPFDPALSSHPIGFRIGEGGSLTVKFDAPITHRRDHRFGLRLHHLRQLLLRRHQRDRPRDVRIHRHPPATDGNRTSATMAALRRFRSAAMAGNSSC